MGHSGSSKRDQFGTESEYYNLIVEMNHTPSLPLLKYLLEKVRLHRYLGLCKTWAERGKANTEACVGRAGGGPGSSRAAMPPEWAWRVAP